MEVQDGPRRGQICVAVHMAERPRWVAAWIGDAFPPYGSPIPMHVCLYACLWNDVHGASMGLLRRLVQPLWPSVRVGALNRAAGMHL